MKDAIIKGKEAYHYEKIISKSKRSKIFDKFILKNINLGKKVCDIGCGPGNTITILKNKSKEIVGIDASSDMINICRKKFSDNSKIKLLLGSATKIKFKSKYFDYVVMRMSLHHIKEKDLAMKEIYRILKEDGRLIIIDKYYQKKWIYFLKGLLNLKKLLSNRFIKSKEYNYTLLSKNFRMIKKEFISEKKGKKTQAFMLVLKKK